MIFSDIRNKTEPEKKGSIPLPELFVFDKGSLPPCKSHHLHDHCRICPKGAPQAILVHDLPLALILRSTKRKTNSHRKSRVYFTYGLLSVRWHD